MSNLSRLFQNALQDEYAFENLKVEHIRHSSDTTEKFLLRLPDGELIETVLIPASIGLYGNRSDRRTLCVSTQVGCAYGCKFCASGLEGFRRNLFPEEIVGQFLLAEHESDQKINNVVFMGMGEPLANFTNLVKAIHILNAPWGLGLGSRKITISTSGLAPQIRQLAEENLQVRLAISLHAPRDEIRDQIMPINRKYPIAELIAACEAYQRIRGPLRTGTQARGHLITFEYILLKNINDDLHEARLLASLARRSHAKVNLIPFNQVEGIDFERPSDQRCQQFRDELIHLGITTTLRNEKGHDIDAACGQLRLRHLENANA